MQAGDIIIPQKCTFCKNARIDITYRKMKNEYVAECFECSTDRMNMIREYALNKKYKLSLELLDTDNTDCTNCDREHPIFLYWFVDNKYHGFCMICVNQMMLRSLESLELESKNEI